MIKADHVSIYYKMGDFKDIGLKEWTMRHLKGNYEVVNFRAVNDVSFELNEGDMMGIIGTNGAGKSTLLKAVIGVMEPRSGHITRNGNVSALLELASGFDGDLTVKENAYFRGAMLGYTREFMDNTYEQIIEFSELREFENRPFKQLSTGMQSRLAFAIASMVQPEILILDEVLSVGDGAFQEKSAKKMREIIDGGAATILVSHSLSQIRELCNKVLWLDHGKQIAFGDTQPICDRYEEYLKTGDINASVVKETPQEADLEATSEVEEKVSVNIEELISKPEFVCGIKKIIQETINTETRLWGDPSRLHIDPTALMVNTLFNTCSGEIIVGANTFTGHNVSMLTGTHYIRKKDTERQKYPTEGRDIIIGSGVWLASNVTVMGPCTIGDNAVIAGCSVIEPGTVIPPNTMYGGNPAKFIREIEFSEDK